MDITHIRTMDLLNILQAAGYTKNLFGINFSY